METNPYAERKREQGYYKTAHKACVNCAHIKNHMTTIPNKHPNKPPLPVRLMSQCGIGEFYVTVNGCCERFEYSTKAGRRIERRKATQGNDIGEMCFGEV